MKTGKLAGLASAAFASIWGLYMSLSGHYVDLMAGHTTGFETGLTYSITFTLLGVTFAAIGLLWNQTK